MKQCTVCDSDIGELYRFCPQCGVALKRSLRKRIVRYIIERLESLRTPKVFRSCSPLMHYIKLYGLPGYSQDVYPSFKFCNTCGVDLQEWADKLDAQERIKIVKKTERLDSLLQNEDTSFSETNKKRKRRFFGDNFLLF